jgi:hypothetical protein
MSSRCAAAAARAHALEVARAAAGSLQPRLCTGSGGRGTGARGRRADADAASAPRRPTPAPPQIPTKIEVFVAPPGADQSAAPPAPGDDGGPLPPPLPSKRLGYLSFDSNERSGHQARELKSVHVSVDVSALRLVVHRCHVNKLNIYNQVRPVSRS